MHTIVAVRTDARVSAECLKDNAMRIEFVAGRGRGRMDLLGLYVSRRVASEIHVALSDALTRKPPTAAKKGGKR
ncbi:MAG TPA: hypothetical protein VMY69_05220 [Phycisphaerae bacterium]|nr:hypothetical protein [Phycisphaerae bacterium]